jgi:hypothetical protein
VIDKKQIRQDLQSGKTIDTVCREYNLTFTELVGLMQFYTHRPRKSHRPKGWLYIARTDNRYIIRKGDVHYGTYKNLRDAQKIRDWMQRHGWDKSQLDIACDWCGVERCTR